MPKRGHARGSVLVTDAEERAVLAACRGLARAGYRVSGCARRSLAPGLWSRSCRERHLVPDPREGAEAFVDAVAAIVSSARPDVVLAGTDVSVLALSAFRARLEGTRLGLPEPETVERCLDKACLIEAAEDAGLLAGGALVCEEPSRLKAAVAALGYPLVVKPRRSFRLGPDGRFQQATAAVVRAEPALELALDRVGFPLLLERYHTGASVVSSAGVAAEGRLLAHVVSRYARTWPPQAGSASFSQTLESPPGLRERTEALVAALGWQGVFELELLDLGGGSLTAIDFNPRPYGSLSLAIAARANLPALWCDWLLGGASRPLATPRRSVRYRCEDAEALNLARALAHGRLRDAAAIVRPRRRTVHAYFRLDDPLPLLARVLSIAWRAIRRRR